MISAGLGNPGTSKDSQSITSIESARLSLTPKVSSGTKYPLLPDLSASTQEILTRLQAQSSGDNLNEASIAASKFRDSTAMSTSEHALPLDSAANGATQVQRPTTASGIFDKSKLKSAFASALVPKAKTLPSQPVKEPTCHLSAIAAVTSPQKTTPRPETTSNQLTETSTRKPVSMKSDESTIEVMPSPSEVASALTGTSTGLASSAKPNAEPTETPKARTRMNHTYVLPSGEVVNSGKGLGRGRPGIKRGPRKPKSTSNLTETAPVSRKRKRSSADSDTERGRRSPSHSHSASDSEDEYSPQVTQTRSGRNIQRPPTFVLPESPINNKRPQVSGSAPATGTGKLSIKRKVYRGKEQSALCEHCLRGYGPLKNVIVFCDGCNRCWHQKCHDPVIPRKLVIDPSTEWFCNECSAIKEQAKKVKKAAPAQKVSKTTAKAEKPATSTTLPTPAEQTRLSYFESLSREDLIELLKQASALAPNLSLWQASTPPSQLQPPPPQSQQPTTTATDSSPNPAAPPAPSTKHTLTASYPTPNRDLSDLDPEAQDDNEQLEADDYYDNDDNDELLDEHARLYPKPGNGVQLPPESEDLGILLEGVPEAGSGSRGTFSHTLLSTREGHVDAAGVGED